METKRPPCRAAEEKLASNELRLSAPVDDVKVGLVGSAYDVAPRDVPASEVVETIRSGKWRSQVEAVRLRCASAVANGENLQGAAKPLKKRLPGIMWCGRFSKRENAGLLEYSGLLCADLDHLNGDLPEIRAKLLTSPHLYTLFTSPTGTGLKAVFRVPRAAHRHSEHFRAVKDHVMRIAGARIDDGCKDVSRLCFVSWDIDAFFNPAATELVPPGVMVQEGCCTDSQTHRLTDSHDAQVVGKGPGDQFWSKEFLPDSPHQTNKLFFAMARQALDLEKQRQRKLSLQELKAAFDVWFDAANPEFLSEDRDTYFCEFCRIRGYVKSGLSEQPMTIAWERARTQPMPAEAESFSKPEIKLLVGLCAHMQDLAGDSAFYLSSHYVAQLLNTKPNQAYRWLRTLEGAGVLSCVKRGDPLKRRATEYRYTGIRQAHQSGSEEASESGVAGQQHATECPQTHFEPSRGPLPASASPSASPEPIALQPEPAASVIPSSKTDQQWPRAVVTGARGAENLAGMAPNARLTAGGCQNGSRAQSEAPASHRKPTQSDAQHLTAGAHQAISTAESLTSGPTLGQVVAFFTSLHRGAGELAEVLGAEWIEAFGKDSSQDWTRPASRWFFARLGEERRRQRAEALASESGVPPAQ